MRKIDDSLVLIQLTITEITRTCGTDGAYDGSEAGSRVGVQFVIGLILRTGEWFRVSDGL